MIKRIATTSITVLSIAMLVAPVHAQQKPDTTKKVVHYANEPIISSIYTADPSVHVFNGKIYIYPSHDVNTGKPGTNGDHYDMQDYHVLSMEDVQSAAKDHGVALKLSEFKWAEQPVSGWTTHHSILQFKGKWYLYYHDTQLSGKNHLRNVKVSPLEITPDGKIITIDPFKT